MKVSAAFKSSFDIINKYIYIHEIHAALNDLNWGHLIITIQKFTKCASLYLKCINRLQDNLAAPL